MTAPDTKPETKKMAKPSLGRGLSALLGESVTQPPSPPQGETLSLDIQSIRPGKYQPRSHFNDEKLTSLIDSIREKGIIQPLVVRSLTGDNRAPFEIIAGERRWRAAKTLDLGTVPAIIKNCSDQEALETALIENIQRDDLTPIEEAEGYQRLVDEFDYTQEQLAKSLGKSRSHVANTLRLNQLPQKIKDLIGEGKISAGHARTLLTASNQEDLIDQILNKGLNVRETEKLAKKDRLEIPENEVDVQSKQLEKQIADLLSLKVNLKIKKSGGILNIHFNSYEEIDELIEKFRYVS
jgi:ParB family chromosome partitioning protein